MKNESQQVDLDTAEEIREMLIHALDSHSWPSIEDALELLNDSLGYSSESRDEEEE